MIYRFDFTWEDGEETTEYAKDQWIAQNKAYWERFGKWGLPAEVLLATVKSTPCELAGTGRKPTNPKECA